jgi:hypothetical protein
VAVFVFSVLNLQNRRVNYEQLIAFNSFMRLFVMPYTSLTPKSRRANFAQNYKTTGQQQLVMFAHRGGGTAYEEDPWRVVFRMKTPLLREARFQMGDRVDVMLDYETGEGCIIRVSKGGYKLCFKMPPKQRRRSPAGQANVFVQWYEGLGIPRFEDPIILEVTDVDHTNNSVAFRIPGWAEMMRTSRMSKRG